MIPVEVLSFYSVISLAYFENCIKGTAEVVFTRREDALAVMQSYNNVRLDGKPMRIEAVGMNILRPSAGMPINVGFVKPIGGRKRYLRCKPFHCSIQIYIVYNIYIHLVKLMVLTDRLIKVTFSAFAEKAAKLLCCILNLLTLLADFKSINIGCHFKDDKSKVFSYGRHTD